MKLLLLVIATIIFATQYSFAQNAKESKPSSKNAIPFGKKLPPPEEPLRDAVMPGQVSPTGLMNDFSRGGNNVNINKRMKGQKILRENMRGAGNNRQSTFRSNNPGMHEKPKRGALCNLGLLRDINALAESNPQNFTDQKMNIYWSVDNDTASYTVLNNVAYFIASDGSHGNELWRSDGTSPGTYMLKEFETGITSSLLFNLTALNGRIYFTLYTQEYGYEPWISDGTAQGTHILKDISPGGGSSYPTKFFNIDKDVFFIAYSDYSYRGAIYKTDGTDAGTIRILNPGDIGDGGEEISQPTVANGLLFFTFYSYTTYEFQLWRSDLTEEGTYQVGPTFPFNYETYQLSVPAQLTAYNNKLYFSADDGTGRKLWVSDGTDAGTMPAPGNNNVMIHADWMNTSFPILNNVLYTPGEGATQGSGLYKLDASNNDGVVKVRSFGADGVTASIVPKEMQVVNNTLYFKVNSKNGGAHEELWSTRGTNRSTQLIYKLREGETFNNLYNGNGILYFVKYDKLFGAELWRTYDTYFGTFPFIVSDIFRGVTSSFPSCLSAINGKLLFTAADERRGNELFITGGSFYNTNLVKDINTEYTSSSDAGYNRYNGTFNGMTVLGNDVVFTANEREYGSELYKSDGTMMGTKLLHDVIPGEKGFTIKKFVSKNNSVYFLAITDNRYAIYKTDGKRNGLVKITSDYEYIDVFEVADNGMVFFVPFNYEIGSYELLKSDGTPSKTVLLSPSVYYNNYLNIIENTAFFVAGDVVNGYELWKSDGSVSGTTLVKDINPGLGGSYPGAMIIYAKEVYFGATASDGATPSLWKSNGTESGTIKLADIDIWLSNKVASSSIYFSVFNNLLYFSAVDYTNNDGTVFWKTDGTVAGTQPVKDLNPSDNGLIVEGAKYLTVVNGMLYFTNEDGEHGRELWKSDGTASGTQLVKDITPGQDGSDMRRLTSFGGKLYFNNLQMTEGAMRYHLWTSDGTADGTYEVENNDDILNIYEVFATPENLYIGGYNYKYEGELYVGKVCKKTGKHEFSKVINEKSPITSKQFGATLYPNPVVSTATLQVSGDSKNISVVISDMNGKKFWQGNNINKALVSLPTEKLNSGTYVVTVSNGKEIKTIKFLKQ